MGAEDKLTEDEDDNKVARTFFDIVRSISKNKENRHKVLYTLCVYLAFSIMGAFLGQIGPSFLDLQQKTGVDIETASWIVTSYFISYTAGTVLHGFLYHRSNIPLLFAVILLAVTPLIAAVPWSNIFPVTIVLFILIGTGIGILDTAGNTEMITHWRENSRPSLILLHLSFFAGGMISPVITAPFLSQTQSNTRVDHDHLNISGYHNSTTRYNVSQIQSYSHWNATEPDTVVPHDSADMLFIPFTITAVSFVLTSIIFFVFIISTKTSLEHTTNLTKESRNRMKIKFSKFQKILGASCSWIIISFCNGIANAFTSYLSTFSVQYLHWSKASGSFATSVFYIGVVIGSLAGIPLTKLINSKIHAGIHTVVLFLAPVLSIISVRTETNILMWISSFSYGFGKSALMPVVLAWTNETFVTLTGSVNSVFFFGAMGFSAVNALFIAFLMKEVGGIWFCYLLLIESIVIILCFISGIVISCCGKRINSNIDKEDVIIDIKS